MTRLIFRLVLVAVLAAALLGAGLAWYALQPLTLAGGRADFTIPRGSGVRVAAQLIAAAGAPVRPEAFYWLARLSRKGRLIKAGSYEITSGITPWALLEKLTAGDVSQREMRVIEGWTFAQMRAAVDAHPDLRHDTAGLADGDLLALIGAVESHPEGLFYPDTYLFDLRSSDVDIYRRSYNELKQRLSRAWATRVADLPLATPYEALTLASIVEKETGRADDRPLVASVFINRLRIGMRLQTDPSVIYGLGESFDGNLRRADLVRDTPYNTYTRAGLPPTPIALAGMASLEAVMQPADTQFLYFVARGDGSSVFSRQLEEHNRAVARYQLGGKNQ